MKIIVLKNSGFQKKTPVLTLLDHGLSHQWTEANSASFNLRLKVDPNDDSSSTLKKMICVAEGNESVRQLLHWQ